MGTENSRLSDLEIIEENIEVTNNWTLHKATIGSVNSPVVSLFHCGGINRGGKDPVPLERYAKSLLVYRHPCILKYISSWRVKEDFYLATEEVKPLLQVLDFQSPLQICVGLHNILKAINFLHDKAQTSHNNICKAAIYVTPDGTWKLGGFEHLLPFSKLSRKTLNNCKIGHNDMPVALENSTEAIKIPTAVDQCAFGILIEELLSNEKEDEAPSTVEFRKTAKQLQNITVSSRPTLSELMNHDFFSQDFIKVYGFLVELPLKSEEDKKAFFSSLLGKLQSFPEKLIATQLSSLLLARLVLLDSTAQKFLLPHILHPRNGSSCEENGVGLLSAENFRQHIVPHLLQMLCVHDAQIRLILLKHFKHYMHMFSLEELKLEVLPELLVGIKDTNDQLVMSTLHALADLVPVLGAAAVIGGKRARFFTDGRPKVLKKELSPAVDPTVITSHSYTIDLAERPSPDGGEDQVMSEEEIGIWSDWENGDTNDQGVSSQNNVRTSSNTQQNSSVALSDITSLDIKNMTSGKEDVDFFEDMVPVISKPPIAEVELVAFSEHSNESSNVKKSERFVMDMSDSRLLDEESEKVQHEGDGWDVDLEELDDWDS